MHSEVLEILDSPAGIFSSENNMRKVIYCLLMGLLILFSAPAGESAMQENAASSEDHPDSSVYSQFENGRLAGWVVTDPRQRITGTMVGLGLIGFVVMNAKRKERA